MDIQPDRDYPTTDLNIMFREMSERNRKEREKIHQTLTRRRNRQEKEEEIRAGWNLLSQEEQQERVEQLQEVCNELIHHHPNYKHFKRARVFFPVFEGEEIMAVIHWNGAKFNETSGWGVVDREIPANMIPVITERYRDGLRKLDKEDEI